MLFAGGGNGCSFQTASGKNSITKKAYFGHFTHIIWPSVVYIHIVLENTFLTVYKTSNSELSGLSNEQKNTDTSGRCGIRTHTKNFAST